MFGHQLYPSTRELVGKMVEPFVFRTEFGDKVYKGLRDRRILDPSAGKGDILKYCQDRFNIAPGRMICCEIDPTLRDVLSAAGYKVVDSDFLKYDGADGADLILMNPPFDDGVDHLLHAWSILEGGDIACVLNAESLRNPYSVNRKLLGRIIGQFGRSEEIGRAFVDAEVRTDVECVIVWLHKAGVEIDFHVDGLDIDDKVLDEDFQASPLAHMNIIESLASQYRAARAVLVEQYKLNRKFGFYVKGVARKEYEKRQLRNDLDVALADLKKMFWHYVFEKTKIGYKTTSDYQKKVHKFIEQTVNLSFSADNVREILSMFYLNTEAIMAQCIESVFRQATDYHVENIIHAEGWKTNRSYRINEKIITPDGVNYTAEFGGAWSTNWNKSDFYDDLDKLMCLLDGKEFDRTGNMSIWGAISRRVDRLRGDSDDYSDWFESEYFRIKFFKKGTVHLVFKRKDLLNDLNLRAAKGKPWVGGGY